MNTTYRPYKYKWWELAFSKYRWARRLSGGKWIKLNEDGYCWVKFHDKEFEMLGQRLFSPGLYSIEIYSKKQEIK